MLAHAIHKYRRDEYNARSNVQTYKLYFYSVSISMYKLMTEFPTLLVFCTLNMTSLANLYFSLFNFLPFSSDCGKAITHHCSITLTDTGWCSSGFSACMVRRSTSLTRFAFLRCSSSISLWKPSVSPFCSCNIHQKHAAATVNNFSLCLTDLFSSYFGSSRQNIWI